MTKSVKIKQIIESWTHSILTEEEQTDMLYDILGVKNRNFDNIVKIIRKHLGSIMSDGGFDGLAMEIDEMEV